MHIGGFQTVKTAHRTAKMEQQNYCQLGGKVREAFICFGDSLSLESYHGEETDSHSSAPNHFAVTLSGLHINHKTSPLARALLKLFNVPGKSSTAAHKGYRHLKYTAVCHGYFQKMQCESLNNAEL